MALTLSFIIGWFAVLSTDSPKPDPTLATVAGTPIRLSQVKTRSETAGVPIAQALSATIDDALMAAQAPFVLKGISASPMSIGALARRVEAAMLDPATLCRKIPQAMRRQWYDETRWRFIAPPAWTVEDTQIICCRSPRKCQAPAAKECLRQRSLDASQLPEAIAQGATRSELQQRFADLFVKRYVFYFDPEQPDAKMDWRLQQVDRTIATAVSALSAGQTTAMVTTRFGFHVLRLVSVRPSIEARFEDPRTQALLRTELCPALLLRQRSQLLEDLRKQTPVRFHSAGLKHLEQAPRHQDVPPATPPQAP